MRLTCFVPIFVLLGMASCSEFIFLIPRGNINSSAEFIFSATNTIEKTTKCKITDIKIRRFNSEDKKWDTIWSISGLNKYMDKIVYQNGNLVDLNSGKIFESGYYYEIQFRELSRMGPVGYGGCRFKIDQMGVIEEIKSKKVPNDT